MTPRQFYIYRFFTHLVPVYPVYLILFSDKGLSLSEISILFMIWSVPLVLLEIPSGLLADIWSRKSLIIIGTAFHAACFAVWIFADGVFLFALGFVFWGISEAMISGALEALLFDSLKQEGKADHFDFVYSRGETIARISLAITMISGGFITQYLGFGAVLFVSIISLVIAVFSIIRIREVNLDRDGQKKGKTVAENGWSVLKKSMLFLFRSKTILLPVLLSILVVGVYGILDEYDPEVASHYMPGVLFIALWGTARFVLEALGSFLAPYMRRRFRRNEGSILPVVIICIFAAGALLSFALLRSVIAILLYAMYFMAMAAAEVLIEDYIQQKIENAGRSTVHSVISLMMNLYAMLFFAVLSGIFALTDIFSVLFVISSYIVLVSVLIGVFLRPRSGNKEQR
ncbi:MAG: MFS transporter [Clostridiaceae bacterium]|nr:MFS transporter [Clostridiaceae bacterium]